MHMPQVIVQIPKRRRTRAILELATTDDTGRAAQHHTSDETIILAQIAARILAEART